MEGDYRIVEYMNKFRIQREQLVWGSNSWGFHRTRLEWVDLDKTGYKTNGYRPAKYYSSLDESKEAIRLFKIGEIIHTV